MTSPQANQLLGVTDVFASWQRTNNTTQSIVLPKPTEFTYDPKAKLIQQLERSKLGVTNPIGQILDEQLPEFDLTFSVKTLTLLAMQYGFAFSNPGTTPVMAVINRLNATQATYLAATTGFEGFGVVENAVSSAAYEDPAAPGVNVQMTQQPFATFNASSVNTYAVGANFGLKLSTDMINANLQNARMVTISTPNLITNGLTMSAEAFTGFSFTYNQILADRSLVQTTWAGMTLSPQPIDSKPETKLKYVLLNPSGGCGVPDVKYLGQLQKRSC